MGQFPHTPRGNNGRFIKSPKRDRKVRNQNRWRNARLTEARAQENMKAMEQGDMAKLELLVHRASEGQTIPGWELEQKLKAEPELTPVVEDMLRRRV
jgi:hypothetical protein